MYKRIQPIQVICYSLFSLAGYTHSLELTTENVYEAEVYVFIYGDTWSKQSRLKYRCLSSTVDWWVDAIVVIQGFKLWYIKKTKFSYEGNFDVDY
jgi:hypothetical protein